MYRLYRLLTYICSPLLPLYLAHRKKIGKENKRSVSEKCSKSFSIDRPAKNRKLLWVHGASVGEAQSALILIKHLLDTDPTLHILVTTGTLTSAELMQKRLPERAFHQFCPLDHPKYVKKFLEHWKPGAVLWMESELWPNMLNEIKHHKISATLINAHMSPKSFDLWKRLPGFAKDTLSVFKKVLCQNDADKHRFDLLGARNTVVTDNIKYSAAPLSYNKDDLSSIRDIISKREVILYASTHDGEETMACRVHKRLKKSIPNLLTIVVPRHPERRHDIAQACYGYELNVSFRGENKTPPKNENDIYIADTLGELGLFYALSPVAYIGRSLSNDGGGGHNPIEAAQLGCAVIHGPNVQNLQDIYSQMQNKKASYNVQNESGLEETVRNLLTDQDRCASLQRAATSFAKEKADVIKTIINELLPQLDNV